MIGVIEGTSVKATRATIETCAKRIASYHQPGGRPHSGDVQVSAVTAFRTVPDPQTTRSHHVGIVAASFLSLAAHPSLVL